MKTVLLFLFAFSFSALTFSQPVYIEKTSPSRFSAGLSLGVSDSRSPHLGFASNVSINYMLSEHFDLSFVTGYFTSFKESREGGNEFLWYLDINNEAISKKYFDQQMVYKYMPFELRGRYNFNKGGLNPYISLNLGTTVYLDNIERDVFYIFKNETTGQIYESKNMKLSELRPLPQKRLQIGLCLGIKYPLNNLADLDLAYLFQGDNVVPVTNNILAGIVFKL